MNKPITVREQVEQVVIEALDKECIDHGVSKRIMQRIESASPYIRRHMDQPAAENQKWVGIATMSLPTLIQQEVVCLAGLFC